MSGKFKKLLGCAVALFIAVGSIPISMLYFTTPIVAGEQFVKLYTTCDTFVYSAAKNKSRARLDEICDIVGNYWNTYYKFDLSALGKVEQDDITNAKLRIIVLDCGEYRESGDSSFNVSFLDNDNWNENMTWMSKPSEEEQYLCTASCSDSGSVLEIDITEFMKKTVDFDDKTITLKLSPSVSSDTPVTLASANSDDPSLRPYLKVALGSAQDPDIPHLDKSRLSSDGYVSAAAPDTSSGELLSLNNGLLTANNDSVIYIKFSLEPRNILGTIESAVLHLRPSVKTTNTEFNIYYLKGSAPADTASMTYNSRPEGETELIKSYNGIDINGDLAVDVTDIIYDTIKRGEYTVGFMIDCAGSDPSSTDSVTFYSSMSESGTPALDITVTDDPEKTALAEASANILGSNTSADNITFDLPSEYTAENGLRVSIKWDCGSGSELSGILGFSDTAVSHSGRITRPAYLEDAETVSAEATLSVGGTSKKKRMILTIIPEFGVSDRLRPLKHVLETD